MLKVFLLFISLISLSVNANKEKVVEELTKVFPSLKGDDVNETPFRGLYEVILRSPKLEIIYVSADGRYLAQGEVIDLQKRVNLTQYRMSSISKEIISEISDSDKIIYKSPNEKFVIDVFTDVDCPYCKKLHKQVKKLNDLGVTVKYLAYPRTGVNTTSYYKSQSVWCSENRKELMDRAMDSEPVPANNCSNPAVQQQMLTADKVNVTGTPSIFFENGDMIPGYVEPEILVKEIQFSLGQYK